MPAVTVGRYVACGFLFHAATGQVLLHHRSATARALPGIWSFFCGGAEPEDGDDPAATWRREVREELGIAVTARRVVYLGVAPDPTAGRPRHVFAAAWPRLEGPFVLGEGDGFAWFTIAAALRLLDLPAAAKADLRRFARRRRLGGAGGRREPGGADRGGARAAPLGGRGPGRASGAGRRGLRVRQRALTDVPATG
jgi:8-oxo-dGTP pyrophosphatase MutT (NUDIX family)